MGVAGAPWFSVFFLCFLLAMDISPSRGLSVPVKKGRSVGGGDVASLPPASDKKKTELKKLSLFLPTHTLAARPPFPPHFSLVSVNRTWRRTTGSYLIN